MSQDKFLNRFRIPSARAPWHGYSAGFYFVTICTANREHFFGNVVRNAFSTNEMVLSPIGEYAHKQLNDVQLHNPYADIPTFVIMPNHIHAIVIIDGRKIPFHKRNAAIRRRDVARNVSEPNGCNTPESDNQNTSEPPACDMQHVADMQSWLTVVIRGFKSSVTKFANEQQIPFAWQSRFHEHIIRDAQDFHAIATYIDTNIDKWNKDIFNVCTSSL